MCWVCVDFAIFLPFFYWNLEMFHQRGIFSYSFYLSRMFYQPVYIWYNAGCSIFLKTKGFLGDVVVIIPASTAKDRRVNVLSDQTDRRVNLLSDQTDRRVNVLSDQTDRRVNVLSDQTDRRVNVLSDQTDRRVNVLSDQTKDYEVGICCLSSKHASLRSMRMNCWLEDMLMSTRGSVRVSMYTL